MQLLVQGKRAPSASCGRDQVFKDLAGKRQPENIQKSLTMKLLSLEEELWQDACNVFIDDLEDMAECTEKFSDDKQFVHTGKASAQRDQARLQERVDRELMKFHKDK